MQGVSWWLIARRVRQRWPALATLAVIVTVGATAALVPLGAADRTASAYDRYLDRANVGDVVVNPVLPTADIDAVIRDLPGVRTVTSSDVFLAAIDAGGPYTFAELDYDPVNAVLQVYGSTDGRYTTMDRPVVSRGRYPSGRNEALVNRELAATMQLDIGDEVPLAFFSQYDDIIADPEAPISPIGVEQVTVVGIGVLADEVLPDELFPRDRMIVSPELAARYDCMPDAPQRQEEVITTLAARRCATAYRYYSVALQRGAQGVPDLLDTALGEVDQLNARLPAPHPEQGEFTGYQLIATTTQQERSRVDNAMRPAIVALGVLGLAGLVIVIVIAGLVVARELRRLEDEQRHLRYLGMTGLHRTAIAVVPLLLAIWSGLVAAVALAWLFSPAGPVGSARTVNASPERQLTSWVALAATVLAVVASVGVAVLGARSTRRMAPGQGRVGDLPAVQRLLRGSERPEVADGVRAAFGGNRGGALAIATGSVGTAAFLAAIVFGASLVRVVSTPAAYGWPWDIAWMTNSGYGPADIDGIATELPARDGVESWTGLGFTNEVSVNGLSVFTVVAYDTTAQHLTVVEGRPPYGDAEIAVGRQTAAQRGIDVGDEVEIGGGPHVRVERATVTGLVVLPPIGPWLSDRASAGTGVLAPEALFDPQFVGPIIGFVGLDLAPDVEPAAALADLDDDIERWNPARYPPFTYDEPVRPPEIVNVESMRAVPLVVGGLLAFAAAVGLSYAVVVSVRSRLSDVAVLRALGFTARQVRRSVRVQALATSAAALAIGMPMGIAVGRVAWRAFASELGVVTDPSVPATWLLGTLAVAFGLAAGASVLPARMATRIAPAAALRSA
ncbi:MAG: FtsX-like permease family protein [Acidimicrobiales bacterium]